MNKTVVLVNAWAGFEEKYPHATVEDFCRHYLDSRKKQKNKAVLTGGIVPPTSEGLLMKIIGRIARLGLLYSNLALQDTGLNQIEEFGVLATILQLKNPTKITVINANLLEVSSGTDLLSRMKKRGLIREQNDLSDKRSKRLSLTAKGERITKECAARITQNSQMLFHGLSYDDKERCISVLKHVEMKFSSLWPEHKSLSFDEVYDATMRDQQITTG